MGQAMGQKEFRMEFPVPGLALGFGCPNEIGRCGPSTVQPSVGSANCPNTAVLPGSRRWMCRLMNVSVTAPMSGEKIPSG